MEFSYILFQVLTISILFVSDSSVMCYKIAEERLKVYNQLGLFPNVSGPESIAFDCLGGGPYTGVSDGRVLKWRGVKLGWTDFAYTSPKRFGLTRPNVDNGACFGRFNKNRWMSHNRFYGTPVNSSYTEMTKSACDGTTDTNKEEMCGRPLGLQFNKGSSTCDLYIADAYFGLLMVGPKGGLATQLANSVEGVPFKFTNDLSIDNSTGSVYFTDTSTVYNRRDYIYAFINGDMTGRLLKYDLNTKKVTVLLKGLHFANGVALNKDNNFLLVSQTTASTILRYWLKGPKAKSSEIFAQLNGFPDNIEGTEDGDFWVALDDGVGSFGNYFTSPNYLRKEKQQVTSSSVKVSNVVGAAVKIDVHGNVVEVLNEKMGKIVMESVSDVREVNSNLWVGSLAMPYVGLFVA